MSCELVRFLDNGDDSSISAIDEFQDAQTEKGEEASRLVEERKDQNAIDTILEWLYSFDEMNLLFILIVNRFET